MNRTMLALMLVGAACSSPTAPPAPYTHTEDGTVRSITTNTTLLPPSTDGYTVVDQDGDMTITLTSGTVLRLKAKTAYTRSIINTFRPDDAVTVWLRASVVLNVTARPRF